MESLNLTIKNILHFIATIQDLCDKKRLNIETLNLQEYNQYVKERKQEQKNSIKSPLREADLVQGKKEQAAAKAVVEEIEEFALVDTLLEKARNIRIKHQDLPKEIKKSANKLQSLSQPSSNVLKSNKVESHFKRAVCKSHNDSNGDKKDFPRSKSALISSTSKTSIVPRSKSANVHQVPKKEDKMPKFETAAKTNYKKSTTINSSRRIDQRTFDKLNTAVLSSKDLSEFKKMNSEFNDCDKILNDKLLRKEEFNNAFASDCSQVSNNQNCLLTFQRFQKELKRTFCLKSCFKLQTRIFWYPYINPKNRNFLFIQKQFDSFDSLTKALKVVHKIQETMLWIDLLSLVGNTLSSLQSLDENDWNVIRLCSYLESIYHEHLQRAPILDTN